LRNSQVSQCVFVSLGIISFKICRRNFDCSHCDLAQLILDFGPLSQECPERLRMIEHLRLLIQKKEEEIKRKSLQHTSNVIPEWIDENITAERFLHRSHIWVVPLSQRRVRVGLDEFAQLLLEPIMGIQVFCDKSTGMIAWDFCCAGRMVKIPCFLDGRIVDVNIDGLMDPSRIHDDPYGSGWLIDLELERDIDLSQLLRARDARSWIETEMERMRHIGGMVTDGGELMHNPAKGIPEHEWRKLVDMFLIQPTKKNIH
jgi:glycine cleavage system H protein